MKITTEENTAEDAQVQKALIEPLQMARTTMSHIKEDMAEKNHTKEIRDTETEITDTARMARNSADIEIEDKAAIKIGVTEADLYPEDRSTPTTKTTPRTYAGNTGNLETTAILNYAK